MPQQAPSNWKPGVSRGQPDSPTTFDTGFSTAQQSALSRSHRHPTPGKASTILDGVSERSPHDRARFSDSSGILMPSETSTGCSNDRGKRNSRPRIGGRRGTQAIKDRQGYGAGRGRIESKSMGTRWPPQTPQRYPGRKNHHDLGNTQTGHARRARRQSSRSPTPERYRGACPTCVN